MAIPKKVDLRILTAFRKLRPILQQAKNRDVNEADTVTLVKAILSQAFGWDPFFDVTSEFAVRSTFVDLAVKSENQIVYLIEVKAIGGDLKDNHLRQALDYAANQGVEWVVLTNGAIWQAHRVIFGKPINHELVFQLDLLNDELRNPKVREAAFVLTKEGMTKSAITQFHAEKQALSKFNVAAIVRSEAVLGVVRRELKRAYPNLNPNLDQIRELVLSEVLKRDVVEGDKADEAVRRMKRVNRPLRTKKLLAEPAPETMPVVPAT
jgi:predicted type IV restriction endonuclease